MVAWSNNIMLRFAYGPQTFRLMRVKAEAYNINPNNSKEYDYVSGTTRYDQAYMYDLMSNIIRVSDKTPDCGLPNSTETVKRIFEYDALYRLIYADGREENATSASLFSADPPQATAPNANNCRAYHENYV